MLIERMWSFLIFAMTMVIAVFDRKWKIIRLLEITHCFIYILSAYTSKFECKINQLTIRTNPIAIMLCNAIHTILLINETQWLIVEEILHRVIITTVSNCVWKKSLLLLYIQWEDGISKSRVVKKIELEFSLFFYKADLVLAIPTRATASNIEGTIIHTYLGIGVRHSQRRSNKVSSI